MDVPITDEVFRKHLSQIAHHDDFAENGRMLMSKLKDFKIPTSTRGRTHGFVIPTLDSLTQKEILVLAHAQKWTAKINFQAKVNVGGHDYTYAHIELHV